MEVYPGLGTTPVESLSGLVLALQRHKARSAALDLSVTVPFRACPRKSLPWNWGQQPKAGLLGEGIGSESCLALSLLPDADAVHVCKDHQLSGLGLAAWRAGLSPGGACPCSGASPAHGTTKQGEMSRVCLASLLTQPCSGDYYPQGSLLLRARHLLLLEGCPAVSQASLH